MLDLADLAALKEELVFSEAAAAKIGLDALSLANMAGMWFL
jgi:hypothetical protein